MAVGVRYGFLRVVGWGNVFGGAFEVVVVCSSGGVGRWWSNQGINGGREKSLTGYGLTGL